MTTDDESSKDYTSLINKLVYECYLNNMADGSRQIVVRTWKFLGLRSVNYRVRGSDYPDGRMYCFVEYKPERFSKLPPVSENDLYYISRWAEVEDRFIDLPQLINDLEDWSEFLDASK